MQMKRVKGHPVMTTLLLVTGLLLLIPLAVLMNVYYFDRLGPGPSDQPWIQEYNFFKGILESTADSLTSMFR